MRSCGDVTASEYDPRAIMYSRNNIWPKLTHHLNMLRFGTLCSLFFVAGSLHSYMIIIDIFISIHYFCVSEMIHSLKVTIQYHQTSNIYRILVGNKIVDHSDVVGAPPVGAAPTISSFSNYHMAAMDWANTTASREGNISVLWFAAFIL